MLTPAAWNIVPNVPAKFLACNSVRPNAEAFSLAHLLIVLDWFWKVTSITFCASCMSDAVSIACLPN